MANLSTNLGNHNHDSRYYTEAEISNLLSGKSNTNHVHDDRYFKMSQIRNAIAAGNADCGSIASKSFAEVSVTYTENFGSNVPIVVASINHKYCDALVCSVFDKTTTGFKIRVYNSISTTIGGVYASWIAINSSFL